MLKFALLGKCGYSVKFSPLIPNYLAVATSEYFGLAGSGTLIVLRLNFEDSAELIQTRIWKDGLYDVVWPLFNPNCIITGSGDGVLQLWDLKYEKVPLKVYSGHYGEISSISCSKIDHQFISSSWDSNIKLWDLNEKQAVSNFREPFGVVHNTSFSKHKECLFSSVSESGNLRIWDTTIPHSIICCKAHDTQILSCDWSPFNEFLIATSGSDGLIRGWDIRNCVQPQFQIKDSGCPVKRIQFSPYHFDILATVGYDFKTKIWDICNVHKPLNISVNHSDFVYGLDWNYHKPGQLADCSWDKMVSIFTQNSLENLKHKM
ncbi:hypothetical protein GWI33_006042 [Rhynchophorus ferrugineus]|uniref:Peroxin-7 n=1 Tax=Rhynchophorus ferrugineus TaxID=354439 RepID=A0A834IUJ0_RHYFE|nr:hypothetical protein GWI33_006042 [Rhynchophorus ferrugineus]